MSEQQKQVREYDPFMGWGMATYEGSHRVSFQPEGAPQSQNPNPQFDSAFGDDREEQDDDRPDYRQDNLDEADEGEEEEDGDEGEDDESDVDRDGDGEGEEGESEEGEGEEATEEGGEEPEGAEGEGAEGAAEEAAEATGEAAAEGAVEAAEAAAEGAVEAAEAAEGVVAAGEAAGTATETAAIWANPWVDVIGLAILVVVVITVIMVAGFSKSGGDLGGAGASGGFFDCSGKVYSFPYAEIGVPTIPKTHHNYSAIDLMSKDGQNLVAVTNGTVSNPHFTDQKDGGISFTLKGDDGYTYYYAHLEYLDPKMKTGYILKAGEYVGRSGHTGNASASAPHLHFGISSSGYPTKGYYPAELEKDAPTAQESPWKTLEAWKNGKCIKPGT